MLFSVTLLPLLLLAVMLGIMRTSALAAASASLASAAAAAFFIYGMGMSGLVMSFAEGAAMALWPIILVITAALFSFNFVQETGRMDNLKKIMGSVSSEKSVQVLLLAWGAGNFLEGIAGYGTAVAIPAGIMVASGFNPFFSAFVCLLSNTVSTAFGAVGIPAITLSLMTELDPVVLSGKIVAQLVPVAVVIPFVLVVLTERSFGKALKHLPETAAASLGFALVYVLSACFLGPQLPTILASLSGMAAVAAVSRLRHGIEIKLTAGEVADTLSVYLIALVLILAASPLFPAARNFLELFSTEARFYPGPEGKTVIFYWVATPGILILISVFAASLITGEKTGKTVNIFLKTLPPLLSPALTIVLLLASATIMRYSGMIATLSAGAVHAAGSLFPLFSPFIGAAGTFLTGSDTSSGILFGEFQKQAGIALSLGEYHLVSAQMAGATAGKMISPQNIAIAAAAAGIKGEEGPLFRKAAIYCFFYLVIIAAVVLAFTPQF